MKDTKTKLSSATIILHWFVGVSIFILIPMGLYMVKIEDYDLYALHSSLGTILFFFILFQIINRVRNGWLQPLNNKKTGKQFIAKIVKWVLFTLAVLYPLSGIIMSIAGGFGLYVFGFELSPAHINPENTYEMIPLNESIANMGRLLHSYAEYLMIIAIFLHIAGVMISHFKDKDGYLNRMFGKNIE